MNITNHKAICKFLSDVQVGSKFGINDDPHILTTTEVSVTHSDGYMGLERGICVKDRTGVIYTLLFNRSKEANPALLATNENGENIPVARIESVNPDPLVTILPNFSE